MITLYRTREDTEAEAVEEGLNSLCMAYETVLLESKEDMPKDLREGGETPVLVDEHDVYRGADSILKHLEALEIFKAQWYKFQSDVCYCDEEGNVEC